MSANFWFAVQRYYIFFILASTYTKKSPLMSENINGGKGMKVEKVSILSQTRGCGVALYQAMHCASCQAYQLL